jgi:phosphate-selective porin
MKNSAVAAWAALTTGALILTTPGLGHAQSTETAGHWRKEPFKLTSPGKTFEIGLAGYIQEDFRSYQDWGPYLESSELRRLRVGVEARWKHLSLEIDVDPRPEPPPDPGEGTQNIKNAYLEYRFDRAFHLRAGHFKIPFSPEFVTSASKIDFIERGVIVDSLDLGRDWGGAALGEIGDSFRYEVGVFAGDGWRSHERAGTTGAARIVVTALTGLEIGGSYTIGQVDADPETEGDLAPKGFAADGPTGFRFAGRHFVQGRRQRIGGDATLRRGPIGLKGEYARGVQERNGQGSVFEDLPSVIFTGWSVAGTWLVTGEKKRNTVRPEHPMLHGPGAVEVGARYEWIDVDDDGPDTGFAGAGNRARNIRPAGDKIFTAGLSWWPRQWMRFMGNVVVEKFEDALLAPEPGKGGTYTTLLARMQLSLP